MKFNLIQYYICVHIWVDTYLMRHKQSQYVTNNVYLNVAMYLHVLLYVIVACGVDTLLWQVSQNCQVSATRNWMQRKGKLCDSKRHACNVLIAHRSSVLESWLLVAACGVNAIFMQVIVVFIAIYRIWIHS